MTNIKEAMERAETFRDFLNERGNWTGPVSTPQLATMVEGAEIIDELLSALRAVSPKPIEEAPKHEELLVYREDAGWLIAEHTCVSAYLSDAEAEMSEFSEDELQEDDWWCFTRDGLDRLSNSGDPTHFIPLDALPKPEGGE
ncbi:MAG: hypothetical protein KAH44_11275 [Oricola sp.]|jgi:hypothetical protein|nr:hypothetical protein [Oricola sp.]